jgi:16S rRNA (cytosine1402-N4)-methyltransferase
MNPSPAVPASSPHISVMKSEILAALAPKDGDIIVDGTFGAGGYSRAILEAADCCVWAIDRDPTAVAGGIRMEQEFPGRFRIIEGCFADMDRLLAHHGIAAVDGVVLDIGVSSMQIDQPERGFSFQGDGPLDMRMGAQGQTAADVVNGFEEADLANVIYQFGEEPRSRVIARAIVAARKASPITRTLELAEIVSKALGGRKRSAKKPIHPATKTFQALRIFVNEELDQLARGLSAAERLLKAGGRLCVVSFHSLEDRIVKSFLRLRSGDEPRASRYLPEAPTAATPPSFRLQFKGAEGPSQDEIDLNPRSRSARLRAALRSEAPAFPAFTLNEGVLS